MYLYSRRVFRIAEFFFSRKNLFFCFDEVHKHDIILFSIEICAMWTEGRSIKLFEKNKLLKVVFTKRMRLEWLHLNIYYSNLFLIDWRLTRYSRECIRLFSELNYFHGFTGSLLQVSFLPAYSTIKYLDQLTFTLYFRNTASIVIKYNQHKCK